MKDYPMDFRNTWNDSDVEAHWDRVASIYIEENDKLKDTHDQRFVESIEYLQLKSGQKIINITSRDCEANDYVIRKEENVEVINTEISSGLMSEAQQRRPYIKQLKIDSYSKLPFEDASFDAVSYQYKSVWINGPIYIFIMLLRINSSFIYNSQLRF